MEQKYRNRFFFGYVSGTCFWSGNDKARTKFDYSIKPEELTLPLEISKRVKNLLEWYDQSLNWNYPPDPGTWYQKECDYFNYAVEKLFETIETPLVEDFELCNERLDLIEDPDLDKYLKNPQEFKRKN